MTMTDPCKQEGVLGKLCAKVEDLVKFKDNHETGAKELWEALNKKASRAFMVTVVVLVMALITALFGLTYETTLQVKEQMAEVKSNLRVMMEQLKNNND